MEAEELVLVMPRLGIAANFLVVSAKSVLLWAIISPSLTTL